MTADKEKIIVLETLVKQLEAQVHILKECLRERHPAPAQPIPEGWQKNWDRMTSKLKDHPCAFDNLPPGAFTHLACQCPRCTPTYGSANEIYDSRTIGYVPNCS